MTIREWGGFLAPFFVFPGEDEMTALAEGGLRVFLREEETIRYPIAEATATGIPTSNQAM